MNTLEELSALVDSKAPESLHLEFKRSAALAPAARRELSKDVSAFANSDGGLIVYGVEEEKNAPVRLDGGIAASEITRETIEQLLIANIAPRIEGVAITRLTAPLEGRTS